MFNTARREVARFLTGYDIYLTPTTARPNLPLGCLDANDPTLDAHGWYSKIFDYAPFTALFNATGNPAISLPLAESERGWPIGVQFVGRYGDEATLLQLAANLEMAMPWADRRPPIYAA
ncbi:amidase family protein [Nocardia sp. NPDC051990]|uniref:amidase family protein n=1 Tax=Nocardia sp. NPDC051990 TaxID=3155285 RepID=UPI0034226E40